MNPSTRLSPLPNPLRLVALVEEDGFKYGMPRAGTLPNPAPEGQTQLFFPPLTPRSPHSCTGPSDRITASRQHEWFFVFRVEYILFLSCRLVGPFLLFLLLRLPGGGGAVLRQFVTCQAVFVFPPSYSRFSAMVSLSFKAGIPLLAPHVSETVILVHRRYPHALSAFSPLSLPPRASRHR